MSNMSACSCICFDILICMVFYGFRKETIISFAGIDTEESCIRTIHPKNCSNRVYAAKETNYHAIYSIKAQTHTHRHFCLDKYNDCKCIMNLPISSPTLCRCSALKTILVCISETCVVIFRISFKMFHQLI